MDKEGTIININNAFTSHFGYQVDDLSGKNFSVLFTETDKQINKPEQEIQKVLTRGAASDENYLIHKDGYKIWVNGESVLAEKDKATYVVKVVHNIHAQKQLERFLLQSHEFIDTVFESIKESALMILDSHLRIVKVNKAFRELFGLKQTPDEGCRLTDINNPFWQRSDVKQELVKYLVTAQTASEKMFQFTSSTEKVQQLNVQAKLVEGTADIERKLLVMIKAVDDVI